MSSRIPALRGEPRPTNLAMALREAFVAVNELVLERLAAAGHAAVRSPHAAVFQYLDDDGTTVSLLAERAQMTKQAMTELVVHLERHGYLAREPDPSDRRAKLVRPTARGLEVVDLAQAMVPELEAQVTGDLGEGRLDSLRRDLESIRRAALDRQADAPV